MAALADIRAAPAQRLGGAVASGSAVTGRLSADLRRARFSERLETRSRVWTEGGMDATERWGTPAPLTMPPATVVGTVGALVIPDPPRGVFDRLDRPQAEPNFPR